MQIENSFDPEVRTTHEKLSETIAREIVELKENMHDYVEDNVTTSRVSAVAYVNETVENGSSFSISNRVKHDPSLNLNVIQSSLSSIDHENDFDRARRYDVLGNLALGVEGKDSLNPEDSTQRFNDKGA
jgi:hypothetical protein